MHLKAAIAQVEAGMKHDTKHEGKGKKDDMSDMKH